jgi:hypothetical protein
MTLSVIVRVVGALGSAAGWFLQGYYHFGDITSKPVKLRNRVSLPPCETASFRRPYRNRGADVSRILCSQ